MRTNMLARWIAALAAVVYLVGGAWAFIAPRSFFDRLAGFPPFNEHFIHDIGSFQVGLALTLLLALAWRAGLRAALAANTVGAALHALSHFIDQEQGGNSSDPWVFTVMAVLLLLATFMVDEPRPRHQ